MNLSGDEKKRLEARIQSLEEELEEEQSSVEVNILILYFQIFTCIYMPKLFAPPLGGIANVKANKNLPFKYITHQVKILTPICDDKELSGTRSDH